MQPRLKTVALFGLLSGFAFMAVVKYLIAAAMVYDALVLAL